MVDAFVTFAVQKLGDFLIQEASLRSSLRQDVQWLRNELFFMQSFLKDAEQKQVVDQRVQQWVFEINSVANDAVAILETYSLEASKGNDARFASRLKACTCICIDNSFSQLEILRLDCLENLERWHLATSAMPLIKGLGIQRCPKLHEIPDRIKDVERTPFQ